MDIWHHSEVLSNSPVQYSVAKDELDPSWCKSVIKPFHQFRVVPSCSPSIAACILYNVMYVMHVNICYIYTVNFSH